jgi:hypothetical protein
MKQVLSLVALSASLAMTASSHAAPPAGPSPTLVLEETVHDAGEVLKGEVVVAEFEIRNTGGADLEILAVKPACGCTSPEFDKLIPPGATGRVVLRVDTGRFGAGPLEKTASVSTNDPDQPALRLAVKAAIRTLVDVSPRDTVTFRELRGESKPQTLTIRSKLDDLSEIRRVEVSDEMVRHRLTRKPARAESGQAAWELELWLDEKAPIGRVSAEVKLHTNSAQAAIVPITVRGSIGGHVDVSPSTLHFRVDSEETARKELTISHRSAAEFAVESSTLRAAKIDADVIEIDTEVIREGASYRVIVNYAGGLEPGNYAGRVVLGTSDAQEPSVEVPLYLIVT